MYGALNWVIKNFWDFFGILEFLKDIFKEILI